MRFALLYIGFISVLSVILTVYDKIAAKKNPKKRIPENTLMYVGILGGAAAMFVTMNIIRHKTLHKKFMIGLPVIIVLQTVIIIIVFNKTGLLGA